MDKLDAVLSEQENQAVRPFSAMKQAKIESLKDLDPDIPYFVKASLHYLESLSPDRELSSDDIAVAKSALEFLQADTFREYSGMIDVYKTITGDDTKRYQLAEKIAAEQTIFLLLSNVFNRSDELIEIATAHGGSKIPARNMLEGVFKKGLSAFLRKGEEVIRISPEAMIEICKKLAKHEGKDTSSWDTEITTIINYQRQAMEEVERIQKGQPTWNFGKAIDYRRNTVGRYSKLLGSIFFDKKKDQEEVFKTFMTIQAHDDLIDIMQDHGVQINPYEALLREDGVWDTFIANFPKSKDHYYESDYILTYMKDKHYDHFVYGLLINPLTD